MKSKNFSIGIDLGGTKVATGLVNVKGTLLSEDRRPSKSPEHAVITVKQRIQFVIDAMADSVVQVIEQRPGKSLRDKAAPIRGIGLAAAGPLDIERGLVVHPANFEGWKVVPIVKLLEKALEKRKLKLKVHFQNDAIAAALGEGWIGHTKNAQTYAMITLGTGIGTGVILNGKPAQSRGMGSEWGHIVVDRTEFALDPKNFYHATLEGIASGTGMIGLARRAGLATSSASEVADFARKGDQRALEIMEKAAHALAIMFCNLSLGFNIERFCVTGGLLPIRDLFLPKAIELYTQMMRDTHPEFLAKISISKLGNKAGVVGAARLPFLPT